MIGINWAEILPQAILYIVAGYIFISVLRFVSLKYQHTEIEHILLSSLVSGYIIVKIMNLIPFSISYEADCVGIICTSAFTGYLIGKLYSLNCFDKILNKLEIRATLNKNIWNDLVDMTYPLYVIITMEDNTEYSGYIQYYELETNRPIICLGAYSKKTPDGIIEDHQYDQNKVIAIDTEKSKSIEFQYYNQSNKCIDIRDLISNHNEEGSPTYREHHPNQ